MRQPQAAKASLPISSRMPRITTSDEEQAQRRGDLDPAGVEAAAAGRRMFGDIGGRAAILTAHRQALQQAQHDQRHRRQHADAFSR